MSVPCWNNSWTVPDFGFLSEAKPIKVTYYNRDGHVLGVDESQSRANNIAWSLRYGHTSNKPVPIGPLSWKKASTYKRISDRYNYYPGQVTSDPNWNGDYSVTEGVFEDVRPFLGEMWQWPLTGEWDDDARNRASVECLNKLTNQKVSIGNFLAEAKKTTEQLASMVIDVGTMLRNAKRGNWFRPVNAKNLTGDASNFWLQWKYGIQPLCKDIYGFYELSRESLRKPMLVNATRTVRDNWEGTLRPGYLDVHYAGVVQTTCKIHAKLADEFLASASHIDVLNPLSIGWELVPYSFVVDWFAPIGNYFSALTAPAGLDFVDGYLGLRINANSDGEYLPSGKSGQPLKISGRRFIYDRAALTSWPGIAPYAKKSPFSTDHVLSALALIRSLKR